jgi:hypothetical protein
MLGPMLSSRELLDSPPILKRPFDTIVSALRSLDADTDGGAALQDHLVKMGEPLYQWPMPDGYPTRTSAWTGTMLPRWNFAYALTANEIGGTQVDFGRFDGAVTAESLFELTHGRRSSSADGDLMALAEKEIQRGEAGKAGASFLCLASPSFQWR